MSEGTEAVPVEAGPSAGTLLRQAREAAGLHVSTLAANLKVPVRKLEALEEDRFEQLGDAVFIRALASSVCRTLKVDPQPVLQLLPQTARPRLIQDSEGINTPFRAPGDGPKPGWLDQISRPVMFTVVALLLAALVIIFLPTVQRGYDTVATSMQSSADPVMPPPGAAATVPTAPAPVETASAAPLAMSPAMAPSAAAPAAAPAPAAPVAAAPNPPAAAAPAAAAAAAATPPASGPDAGTSDANGIVTFRARAPSWVQVTDARGATVFRRLMVNGETAGANGALPLSVTVGSAESTDVQVRGKPFNLAPVSRDNVARFEIK